MDEQAKTRDKTAHSLWAAHKEKLGELRFNQLNLEKIKQAAERHEQVINTEKFEAFKMEYPILEKYDALLKQRQHLTGYLSRKNR